MNWYSWGWLCKKTYSSNSSIRRSTVEKERMAFSRVCLRRHSQATSMWVCPTPQTVTLLFFSILSRS